MTWVFAALVVAALGGVAAVAAGRFGAMPEAYDDRPDLAVPPTGPLGSDDLRRVRFSLAFRGYRMSEVDALLERLSDQLDDQLSDQLDDQLDAAGPPVRDEGVPADDVPD